MSETKFTYDEVRKTLCEACNLGARDWLEIDRGEYRHSLNGQYFNCTASMWRMNRAVLAKAFPDGKETK